MLSQLLFVRLKTAENALRDGRLDEAYRLASAPDLRHHRRAGAVLAALTERFLERARSHFRADRFTEALMDLERAEAGGVMTEAVAELRSHVHTVHREQQRLGRAGREPGTGRRRMCVVRLDRDAGVAVRLRRGRLPALQVRSEGGRDPVLRCRTA